MSMFGFSSNTVLQLPLERLRCKDLKVIGLISCTQDLAGMELLNSVSECEAVLRMCSIEIFRDKSARPQHPIHGAGSPTGDLLGFVPRELCVNFVEFA